MKQWQAWVGSVLISSLFWLGCASSRLSEKREPYASFQFYYEQNNEKIEVLIESYPDKKIPYNHITGKDINARDDYFDGTIDAVVEGNKEEIEKMYKFGLDRANALGQVKEVEWAFVYLA